MNSLSLSAFLFSRVENTILQRDYIKNISISFEHSETFGNKYIKLSYVLSPNKKYYSLSAVERIELDKAFNGSPYYIFSLITHSQNRYGKKYEDWLRLLEFKTIYSSLTSYIIAQFEKYLSPDTKFTIQGVNHWPQFNYAAKYLKQMLESQGNQRRDFKHNYEIDIAQYAALHELSHNSNKLYLNEKAHFVTTDYELANLNLIELSSIRQIVRSHQVPIHAIGNKTIDKIEIHLSLLVNALKTEISQLKKDTSFFSPNKKKIDKISLLIEYIYNIHLPDEKKEIEKVQKRDFIRNFAIQKGDVLELNDGRLVLTDSVLHNQGEDIEIKYFILKTDLSTSVRQRTVTADHISFFLKSSDFREYQQNNSFKQLPLLKKWMEKKKHKFIGFSFKLDLINGQRD